MKTLNFPSTAVFALSVLALIITSNTLIDKNRHYKNAASDCKCYFSRGEEFTIYHILRIY